MAQTPKILGQAAPSAASATDVYTVPSSTNTIVSSIRICNQGAAIMNVRVALRAAGATLTGKQYVIYDYPLTGNGALEDTCGYSLAATDVITVQFSTANGSVTICGMELT